MKAIWKFRLTIKDDQIVWMPIGAKIISYQAQAGELCIWAEVDIEELAAPRKFRIIGTGQPFEDFEREYIGSVLNAGFVWHLYELREEEKK